MAIIIRCEKCGARYRHGEDHVCPETGLVSDKPMVNDAPASPPEPILAAGALTGAERQKRWREKNREKYNAYKREYRRRK